MGAYIKRRLDPLLQALLHDLYMLQKSVNSIVASISGTLCFSILYFVIQAHIWSLCCLMDSIATKHWSHFILFIKWIKSIDKNPWNKNRELLVSHHIRLTVNCV